MNDCIWFYVVLGIEFKALSMLVSFLSTELIPALFRDKVLFTLTYNCVAHAGLKLAILLPHLLGIGFVGMSHHSYLLRLSSESCFM